MSVDYYTVKIGTSLWLSQDGTEPDDASLACRVTCDGLSRLAPAKTGPITKGITGKPYKFLQENTAAGVELSLKPFVLLPSVLASIQSVIDTAEASDSLIRIQLTDGELPDYDLDCMLELVYSGNFVSGQLEDVELRATVSQFH